MLILLLACTSTPPDRDSAAPVADTAAPCPQVVEDVRIPTEDGSTLAALVRHPEDPACQLPTIVVFTPYGRENGRRIWLESDQDEPLFDSPGYALVIAEWRGTFDSDAASRADEAGDGRDGYDLVEWVAAQPWSDGRTGMFGASALGRVQYWTATERPPHLTAIVPIFADMNYYYEAYFPGGVARYEYIETTIALFGGDWTIYETWPYRTAAWTSYIETTYDPADLDVPTLIVSGWYDLMNSTTHRSWSELRSGSPAADQLELLIGPWFHFAVGGESTWGQELSEQERLWTDPERLIQRAALDFFDHHLRGQARDRVPVRYEQAGDWIDAETWPPAATERRWYLAGDGTLRDTAPSSGSVRFPFDPDDPSPTVGGQTLHWDYTHGPDWQDEVLARDDAVAFVSDALTEPLTIAGPIRVELEAATTGADADIAVRFTDVFPDGRHLQLTDGVQRIKLSEDLGVPFTVEPGHRYPLVISLTNELAYTFEAGHRVGVILSGGQFGRFDRNPGTGDDLYHQAAAPVAVEDTVYTDGTAALILPVVAGRGTPAPATCPEKTSCP